MEEYIDDFLDKFRSDDRILELTTFAEQYQLGFIKRDRFGPQDHRLKGFKIFSGKKGKRLRGIISNPEPTLSCSTRIYDYHYYGDGGTKKTTIIEIKSPDILVPSFILQPKGKAKRLKEMFVKGRSVIRDATFNDHYTIQSDDPDWIQMTFDDDLLDLILSKKKVTIEGSRNYLLVYYKKKRIDMDKLIKEYEFALDLYDYLAGNPGQNFV